MRHSLTICVTCRRRITTIGSEVEYSSEENFGFNSIDACQAAVKPRWYSPDDAAVDCCLLSVETLFDTELLDAIAQRAERHSQ